MFSITPRYFAIRLEGIAALLGIQSYSRGEAEDWAIHQIDHSANEFELADMLVKIKEVWSANIERGLHPDDAGDPFGILTFWEDSAQQNWDNRQRKDPTVAFGKMIGATR